MLKAVQMWKQMHNGAVRIPPAFQGLQKPFVKLLVVH